MRAIRRYPAVLAGLLGAAVLAAGCSSTSAGDTKTGTLHIGVLQMASAAVLDQTVSAFESELRAKLAPRQVDFDLKNAQGDQSLITSISRSFVESNDTAFAVIGTPAVISLSRMVKTKPIFAVAMGDPVGAKVAKSLAQPGGNVTGSTDYVDPALLLEKVMAITPAPKRLGTIYDPSNQNLQVWVKALHAAAAKYPGLTIVETTVSGAQDVPTAARSLAGRVDAEMIGPDVTVFSGLAAVGSTAKANGLPVYVIGGDSTTAGILASIGPDYPTVGRLAGDAAARVLQGTDAGEVPFGQPTGVTLTVNKATLSRLHVTIPQSILASATVQ
jgi:putative ABC transport system substrate-binding protein